MEEEPNIIDFELEGEESNSKEEDEPKGEEIKTPTLSTLV